MRWLDRARELAKGATTDPTKPTKGASVGFVGASPAPFAEIEVVSDPEFSNEGPPNFPEDEAFDGAEAAPAPEPEPEPTVEPVKANDRHTAQVMVFHRRGIRNEEAEQLAKDVARRAREFDDRRICLECRNLQGHKCAVSALAGAGVVVTPLLRMPQRCPGFEAAR